MQSIKNFFATMYFRITGNSQESVPVGFALNEEFESKRTTKLGMIFVVIMVATGVWQGQALFNSIKQMIAPPEQLSSCYFQLTYESGEKIVVKNDSSGYQGYNGSRQLYGSYFDPQDNDSLQRCQYSQIEITNSVPALYDSVKEFVEKRDGARKQKSDLENELSRVRYATDNTRQSYNTALYEQIAQTGATVYSPQDIGQSLRTKEQTIADLEKMVTLKDQEINEIGDVIKQKVLGSVEKIYSVRDDFNERVRWLELKRFLVSILLLAPFAFFALRKYFRSKNERSEYAIIWGGIALIATILSSQVFIVFAYRILPHQIIESIVAFFGSLFSQFAFLFVLFQWLALILVPLFFGFLIYQIQKRYYNKDAVVMRALKEGKCPRCTMKIKDQMVHCPSCAYLLKKECQSCHFASISYARFCESCGIPFENN